jgi:hypothetical protein
MRKFMIVAVVALALVAGTASAVGASSARAPYCGITWGSLVKADPAYTSAPITNVRSGRHACFDRLVIDLAAPVVPGGGQGNGYHVRYVPQVTQDGSGDPVPLAGGAFLEVIVHAPAYDVNTGVSTYNPPDPSNLVNVSGYPTFRQVADAGSFEGQTTIGLGVRARLPFRVFVLAGPGSGSRMVIDVAHRW